MSRGLHSSGNGFLSTLHQKAIRDWLIDIEFNIMATLTFKVGMGVSLYSAEKAFCRFSEKLKGSVWKRNPNDDVMYAPVVENSFEQQRIRGSPPPGREGTHIHVLLKLPGELDENRKRIRNLWVSTSKFVCGDPSIYCPDGDKWCVGIETLEEREAYIGYVAKHMQDDCTGLLVNQLRIGR